VFAGLLLSRIFLKPLAGLCRRPSTALGAMNRRLRNGHCLSNRPFPVYYLSRQFSAAVGVGPFSKKRERNMMRKHRATITWLLVVVMTFSPAMVYAQPPMAGQASPATKAKIDIGYVTPGAFAAAVVYPRHVLTAPEMEMLPIEVFSAGGKKELGIDPVEIEQILAFAEAPQSLQAGPPQAGIVLRMVAPLSEGEILAPLWRETEEAQLNGKSYRKARDPMMLSIFRPDDRTLILAHDGLLQKMLDNRTKPQAGRMSKILAGIAAPPDAMAVVLVEPIRPLIAQPLAMAPVPPPFADLKKIPELLNSIGTKINLTGDTAATLTIRAADEQAAEQLEQMIDKYLALGKQMMLAEMAKQPNSNDPVEQAGIKYTQRISEKMMQLLRPVRKGNTLTLGTAGGKNNPTAQVATIGILVALLLPAVQAAREAARRMTSINNMKQLLLAMHNYAAKHREFPARAIFDKQGKPLLSWRVQLLPYMEPELYKQFHLDEPWDSPHNRALIPMMPKFFQNPSGTMRPGMANYLAVSGSGLAFDGSKGLQFKDVKDGLSNTILLVEANDDQAVVWTKPDDWQCNPKQPMAGLGNAHAGGFNVGFGDGSVRFIAGSIDPKVFHSLLTIAGGEMVTQDR
jgi:prepilin-type processing-associated H-X9-DG protein